MINPTNIASMNFGRYTDMAAAKSVAGIGVPEFVRAHDRAKAVFLCAMHGFIQIMVSRAGASKDAPGSLATGYANPVRFTTSKIGVFGGDISLSQEAVIMTTIPTKTTFETHLRELGDVTFALRYLRKIEHSSPEKAKILSAVIDYLSVERKALTSAITPNVHHQLGISDRESDA